MTQKLREEKFLYKICPWFQQPGTNARLLLLEMSKHTNTYKYKNCIHLNSNKITQLPGSNLWHRNGKSQYKIRETGKGREGTCFFKCVMC